MTNLPKGRSLRFSFGSFLVLILVIFALLFRGSTSYAFDCSDDPSDETCHLYQAPSCSYDQYSEEYSCQDGYRCYNDYYIDESTGCQWIAKSPHYHCDYDPSCATPQDTYQTPYVPPPSYACSLEPYTSPTGCTNDGYNCYNDYDVDYDSCSYILRPNQETATSGLGWHCDFDPDQCPVSQPAPPPPSAPSCTPAEDLIPLFCQGTNRCFTVNYTNADCTTGTDRVCSYDPSCETPVIEPPVQQPPAPQPAPAEPEPKSCEYKELDLTPLGCEGNNACYRLRFIDTDCGVKFDKTCNYDQACEPKPEETPQPQPPEPAAQVFETSTPEPSVTPTPAPKADSPLDETPLPSCVAEDYSVEISCENAKRCYRDYSIGPNTQCELVINDSCVDDSRCQEKVSPAPSEESGSARGGVFQSILEQFDLQDKEKGEEIAQVALSPTPTPTLTPSEIEDQDQGKLFNLPVTDQAEPSCNLKPYSQQVSCDIDERCFLDYIVDETTCTHVSKNPSGKPRCVPDPVDCGRLSPIEKEESFPCSKQPKSELYDCSNGQKCYNQFDVDTSTCTYVPLIGEDGNHFKCYSAPEECSGSFNKVIPGKIAELEKQTADATSKLVEKGAEDRSNVAALVFGLPECGNFALNPLNSLGNAIRGIFDQELTDKCNEIEKQRGAVLGSIGQSIQAVGAGSQEYLGDSLHNSYCKGEYNSFILGNQLSVSGISADEYVASLGCAKDTRTRQEKAIAIQYSLDSGQKLGEALASGGYGTEGNGTLRFKIEQILADSGIKLDEDPQSWNAARREYFIQTLTKSDPEFGRMALDFIGFPLTDFENQGIARDLCVRDNGYAVCVLGDKKKLTDYKPAILYESFTEEDFDQLKGKSSQYFPGFTPASDDLVKAYAREAGNAIYQSYDDATKQSLIAKQLGISINELSQVELTYRAYNASADKVMRESASGNLYMDKSETAATNLLIGVATGGVFDGADYTKLAAGAAKIAITTLAYNRLVSKFGRTGADRAIAKAGVVVSDDLVSAAKAARRVDEIIPERLAAESLLPVTDEPAEAALRAEVSEAGELVDDPAVAGVVAAADTPAGRAAAAQAFEDAGDGSLAEQLLGPPGDPIPYPAVVIPAPAAAAVTPQIPGQSFIGGVVAGAQDAGRGIGDAAGGAVDGARRFFDGLFGRGAKEEPPVTAGVLAQEPTPHNPVLAQAVDDAGDAPVQVLPTSQLGEEPRPPTFPRGAEEPTAPAVPVRPDEPPATAARPRGEEPEVPIRPETPSEPVRLPGAEEPATPSELVPPGRIGRALEDGKERLVAAATPANPVETFVDDLGRKLDDTLDDLGIGRGADEVPEPCLIGAQKSLLASNILGFSTKALAAGRPCTPSVTDSSYHSPQKNEDTPFVNPRSKTAVVSDGAGGGGGDPRAASQQVADSLSRALDPLPATAPEEAVIRATRDGFRDAQERVISSGKGGYATGTSAKIIETPQGRKVVVGNVGDSRAYIIDQHGNIRQITRDQSRVTSRGADQVSSRAEYERLTPSERIQFDRRNEIEGAIGIRGKPPKPDVYSEPLPKGSRVVVTSDGVHDNLTELEIREILTGRRSPSGQPLTGDPATDLVREARIRSTSPNIRAKQDDITAGILDPDNISPQIRPVRPGGPGFDPFAFLRGSPSRPSPPTSPAQKQAADTARKQAEVNAKQAAAHARAGTSTGAVEAAIRARQAADQAANLTNDPAVRGSAYRAASQAANSAANAAEAQVSKAIENIKRFKDNIGKLILELETAVAEGDVIKADRIAKEIDRLAQAIRIVANGASAHAAELDRLAGAVDTPILNLSGRASGARSTAEEAGRLAEIEAGVASVARERANAAAAQVAQPAAGRQAAVEAPGAGKTAGESPPAAPARPKAELEQDLSQTQQQISILEQRLADARQAQQDALTAKAQLDQEYKVPFRVLPQYKRSLDQLRLDELGSEVGTLERELAEALAKKSKLAEDIEAQSGGFGVAIKRFTQRVADNWNNLPEPQKETIIKQVVAMNVSLSIFSGGVILADCILPSKDVINIICRPSTDSSSTAEQQTSAAPSQEDIARGVSSQTPASSSQQPAQPQTGQQPVTQPPAPARQGGPPAQQPAPAAQGQPPAQQQPSQQAPASSSQQPQAPASPSQGGPASSEQSQAPAQQPSSGQGQPQLPVPGGVPAAIGLAVGTVTETVDRIVDAITGGDEPVTQESQGPKLTYDGLGCWRNHSVIMKIYDNGFEEYLADYGVVPGECGNIKPASCGQQTPYFQCGGSIGLEGKTPTHAYEVVRTVDCNTYRISYSSTDKGENVACKASPIVSYSKKIGEECVGNTQCEKGLVCDRIHTQSCVASIFQIEGKKGTFPNLCTEFQSGDFACYPQQGKYYQHKIKVFAEQQRESCSYTVIDYGAGNCKK